MTATTRRKLTIIFLPVLLGLVSITVLGALAAPSGPSTPPGPDGVAQPPAGYTFISEAADFTETQIVMGKDGDHCEVETMVWGITSDGRIGMAVCIGMLQDGTQYEVINIDAYERLAYTTEDLAGGIFDLAGHGVRVRNIEFAVDPRGRVILSALDGKFVDTGDAVNYALPVSSVSLTPECCKFYTGATDCQPLASSPCTSPGSCTGTPRTCSCLPLGNGDCVATLGSLCGGGCGGNCPAGTCTFWVDPMRVPQCECRGS